VVDIFTLLPSCQYSYGIVFNPAVPWLPITCVPTTAVVTKVTKVAVAAMVTSITNVFVLNKVTFVNEVSVLLCSPCSLVLLTLLVFVRFL